MAGREDLNFSLDEYYQKNAVGSGLDVNKSLDEISHSNKRIYQVNSMSLDGLTSQLNKHRFDGANCSLSEIIQSKNIEGPKKYRMDCDYNKRKKKSKWERYKCDTDEEEEEEEEDDGFIPAHISSDEEEETKSVSSEEPMYIPLQGGGDDDEDNNVLREGRIPPEEFYNDPLGLNNDSLSRDSHSFRGPQMSRFGSTKDLTETHMDEEEVPVSAFSGGVPADVMLAKYSYSLASKSRYDDNDKQHFAQLFSSSTSSTLVGQSPFDKSTPHRVRPKTVAGTASIGRKLPVKRPAAYDEDITGGMFGGVSSGHNKRLQLTAHKLGDDRRKSAPLLNVTSCLSAEETSDLSLEEVIRKAKSYFTSEYSTSRGLPSNCPQDLVAHSLEKYWNKRYRLFSKFDDGIKLDYESWYSVTPESVAQHIAERCYIPDGVIVDGFCGCGGNTIQFAKKMKKVIAIDIDPTKIAYAKHNAKIYGVSEKIKFVCGDFLELAPTLKADGVFLSPPWGGPSYLQKIVFDMKKMIPMDGFRVFEMAKRISNNIAYFVPRTTNQDQLVGLGLGAPVEIENNADDRHTIACTAYYGDFVKTPL